MNAPWAKTTADGLLVTVKVRTRAGRDAVTGLAAGAVRVCTTAAPEQGKANEALRGFFARALRCRQSEVELLTGAASPRKIWRFRTLRAAAEFAAAFGLANGDEG